MIGKKKRPVFHPGLMGMTPANLRRVREEAGLTQTDLARLVHMSGATRISDWERGVHPIAPECWELLLIKLNYHPVYCARQTEIAS